VIHLALQSAPCQFPWDLARVNANFEMNQTFAEFSRSEGGDAMESDDPAQPQSPSPSPAAQLGETVFSAVRFWEPRRLLYNALLAVVVVTWIVATWPHFRPAMKLASLLPLTVLALLANLCYSAAYLADMVLRNAALRTLNRYRWGVWVLGTLLALVFENYWISDEIYPFVQ
jgi:hypothetical protein